MTDVFVSEAPEGESKEKEDQKPNVTRHRHLPKKDALPGYTKNPLSAYCYYPDHVKFVGTDSEEKVVLLLRRHMITNIGWIVTLSPSLNFDQS